MFIDRFMQLKWFAQFSRCIFSVLLTGEYILTLVWFLPPPLNFFCWIPFPIAKYKCVPQAKFLNYFFLNSFNLFFLFPPLFFPFFFLSLLFSSPPFLSLLFLISFEFSSLISDFWFLSPSPPEGGGAKVRLYSPGCWDGLML